MFLLVLFLIAILVSIIVALVQYRRKIFAGNVSANPLKDNGIRVSLKTSDIIVKSREYWVEDEEPITRVSMLDSLYGKNSEGAAKEKRTVSVLIFEGEKNGKTVKYVSPSLYKDEATIRFALSRMDSLNVYIDRNNESNYYFDVTPLAGI